jgi:hypothetical protein
MIEVLRKLGLSIATCCELSLKEASALWPWDIIIYVDFEAS